MIHAWRLAVAWLSPEWLRQSIPCALGSSLLLRGRQWGPQGSWEKVSARGTGAGRTDQGDPPGRAPPAEGERLNPAGHQVEITNFSTAAAEIPRLFCKV